MQLPCGDGLHTKSAQQVHVGIKDFGQRWSFSTQIPFDFGHDCSSVSPFWTPLIDTSKLRGEANISIVRMAKIRTMKGTIVKQCHSNIEGKTFCNTF